MAILEKQSMTTNTQSLPSLVEGILDMYSMEMDSQGPLGVGKCVYNPCFLMEGLVMAQAVKDLIY